MIEGTTYIKAHLARFSLTMHCGKDGQKSKTEALLVRAAVRRTTGWQPGDEFRLNDEYWVLDRHPLREISCSVCKRQWFTADSDSAMTDFLNHLSVSSKNSDLRSRYIGRDRRFRSCTFARRWYFQFDMELLFIILVRKKVLIL